VSLLGAVKVLGHRGAGTGGEGPLPKPALCPPGASTTLVRSRRGRAPRAGARRA